MQLTEEAHGAEYRQETDLESERTMHKLMNIGIHYVRVIVLSMLYCSKTECTHHQPFHQENRDNDSYEDLLRYL